MEICGIDEAGRGCVAGSLFVCGLKCDDEIIKKISRVADSKKLTPKTRKKIFDEILALKIEFVVKKINAQEIDKLGISACMRGALDSIKNEIESKEYIFDGNTSFGASDIKCVIKGDNLIPQISLASIVAKVHKDGECEVLDSNFPQYKLKKNKGYATKEHIEAIKKYGFSPIHRRSFKIKEI